jgi:hypothetical protein
LNRPRSISVTSLKVTRIGLRRIDNSRFAYDRVCHETLFWLRNLFLIWKKVPQSCLQVLGFLPSFLA